MRQSYRLFYFKTIAKRLDDPQIKTLAQTTTSTTTTISTDPTTATTPAVTAPLPPTPMVDMRSFPGVYTNLFKPLDWGNINKIVNILNKILYILSKGQATFRAIVEKQASLGGNLVIISGMCLDIAKTCRNAAVKEYNGNDKKQFIEILRNKANQITSSVLEDSEDLRKALSDEPRDAIMSALSQWSAQVT